MEANHESRRHTSRDARHTQLQFQLLWRPEMLGECPKCGHPVKLFDHPRKVDAICGECHECGKSVDCLTSLRFDEAWERLLGKRMGRDYGKLVGEFLKSKLPGRATDEQIEAFIRKRTN